MKLRSNIALCSALALTLIGANAHAQLAGKHWARKSNPVPLKVVDSVTIAWDASFTTALQKWSESPVFDMTVVSRDDAATTRQACSLIQGQLRVCNYTYGTTGWLGLATIGVDANGHIDKARVRLNDSYTASWSVAGQRNHVACHEIGHTIGFDHMSSGQGTCMDLSQDLASQWPSLANYEFLLKLYGHADTYNSYAGATTTTSTTTSSTTTSSASTTTTCTGRNKKTCTASGFDASEEEPSMGTKVRGDKKEQTWVAPRKGGGIWIHQVDLVP